MKKEFWIKSIALAAVLVFSACAPNEQVLNSGKETPAPATSERPAETLDTEIEALRTADFRFIWVLKRKDGGTIDDVDKAVIRVNTVGVNRRVLSSDEKAVLIGTNAVPPKQNVDALFAYFAVDDLSPEPMPSPTSNTTNKRTK